MTPHPLPRGLIVSCQAGPDNPLHGPTFMVAIAQAAQQGGAVAIRAEARFSTPQHVAAAFRAGAHAVVVGTAITNPRELTRTFSRAVPDHP